MSRDGPNKLLAPVGASILKFSEPVDSKVYCGRYITRVGVW